MKGVSSGHAGGGGESGPLFAANLSIVARCSTNTCCSSDLSSILVEATLTGRAVRPEMASILQSGSWCLSSINRSCYWTNGRCVICTSLTCQFQQRSVISGLAFRHTLKGVTGETESEFMRVCVESCVEQVLQCVKFGFILPCWTRE